MRRALRLLAVAAVVVACVVGSPVAASAHPLGNFTTNRYARIEIGARHLRVHYVLDEAELVAFRSRQEVAADAGAFARRRVAEIASRLRLRIDGRDIALSPVVHRLDQPEGQGGLRTLRLDIVFETRLPDRRSAVDAVFEDRNQPDRLGWREIVVAPTRGAEVSRSTVASRDRTESLRNYPSDPGTAPLDVRQATFRFVRGDGADPPARIGSSAPPVTGGNRFERLLSETTGSPIAIGVAAVVALLFGAVHALGPGHGKTVMAAYLVSTAGRRRDAVALGTIVSLMHTASVLLLGIVLTTVGRGLDAGRIYPLLTLIAGTLVAGTGIRLAAVRIRAWRGASQLGSHDHGHGHTHDQDHPGDHVHDHPGDHEHRRSNVPVREPQLVRVGAEARGAIAVVDAPTPAVMTPHRHGSRTHSHELPEDVRPLSRAGLVALAASGGLFPSPSAVVVLVGAFALGRGALGLLLIAAFSLGLAGVLVAVGLVLVAGRGRLASTRFAVASPWLPTVAAFLITGLGIVLITRGLVGVL